MFFGSPYSRHDIVFAHAWYATLWGPSGEHARLRRLKVRLGALASLKREDAGVKQCYGAIVRARENAWVAYCRLERRVPALRGTWPGSRNLPGYSMRTKTAYHVSRTLEIPHEDARRMLAAYVGEE
jgi:hypothetical protein